MPFTASRFSTASSTAKMVFFLVSPMPPHQTLYPYSLTQFDERGDGAFEVVGAYVLAQRGKRRRNLGAPHIRHNFVEQALGRGIVVLEPVP